MDDFVVICERGGKAYVERFGAQIKVIEPIILRYDAAGRDGSPPQITMELAPPILERVDLPVEWRRHLPRFHWLNRFNSRCGCLLDESCVEPHVCNQKIWVERQCQGTHQHIL